MQTEEIGNVACFCFARGSPYMHDTNHLDAVQEFMSRDWRHRYLQRLRRQWRPLAKLGVREKISEWVDL
jgi:hypothetical protein